MLNRAKSLEMIVNNDCKNFYIGCPQDCFFNQKPNKETNLTYCWIYIYFLKTGNYKNGDSYKPSPSQTHEFRKKYAKQELNKIKAKKLQKILKGE